LIRLNLNVNLNINLWVGQVYTLSLNHVDTLNLYLNLVLTLVLHRRARTHLYSSFAAFLNTAIIQNYIRVDIVIDTIIVYYTHVF
jgi:hypothetical protein